MKKLLTLVGFGLIFSMNAMSDASLQKTKPSTGTATEHDKYVDELSTKKAAIEKDLPLEIDNTQNGQSQTYSKEDDQERMEEMKENPRNPAMVESFGQVGSKKDEKKPEVKKGRDYARP